VTVVGLQRDGFFRLRAVFDADRVITLRAQIAAVRDEQRPVGCARANNELIPLRFDDELVIAALSTPGFLGRVGAVADASDLRWISGYISVRPPCSGPLPTHQDWWCWRHEVTYERRPTQLAVLCYLDRLDSANAALIVKPRSHHGPGEEETIVPVDAGDVVVLDYRLLHGTTANETNVSRDCLLLTFTPSWRELPLEVRGHLISHSALPRADERATGWWSASGLLLDFAGPPADLTLDRERPAGFAVSP